MHYEQCIHTTDVQSEIAWLKMPHLPSSHYQQARFSIERLSKTRAASKIETQTIDIRVKR
jgi:hypothetical protein